MGSCLVVEVVQPKRGVGYAAELVLRVPGDFRMEPFRLSKVNALSHHQLNRSSSLQPMVSR